MAKVLVEIKNNIYHAINSGIARNGGMESAVAMDAISSGIILTDLTNGEVMQKVFNMSLDEFKRTWGGGDFTDTWWNSKWGE